MSSDRLSANPGVAASEGPADVEDPSTRAGARAKGRSAAPLARLATVVALLAAPVVVFFGLQVIPFFVQNGVDPFIYVGYQQSLGDLVERFGYTYYFPVRFGMLIPFRLTSLAFGAVPGYFVARYALALLAATALYALGRSRGSRAAGWVGAAACLCSPVFIGSLMTEYTDTVAVPCMIGGVALLMLPADGARPWRAAAAGVLFGIAFNTNLFIAVVLASGFLARAVLHVLRREWYAFVDWLVVAVGVVVVTGLGSLYYGLAFGDFDILTPSIDAARLYSGDAGAVFRAPTRAWLSFSPHLYIPALIGLALLVLVLTRRAVPDESWLQRMIRPGAADALVMLGGGQLFFGIHQFLLDGYSMETSYYYAFLWPFAMVALVFAAAEASTIKAFGSRGLWASVAVVALLPVARNWWFEDLELRPFSVVPVLAVIVGIGLLVARFVPLTAWVGVLGLVAGVSLLAVAPPRDVPLSKGQTSRVDPHYELMTGNHDDIGISYYRGAADLADVVPKWKDDPGSTLYWYRNDSLALNHIQSSGLWRGTTIDLGGSFFPVLDQKTVTLLKGRTPRHIVVIAESARDMRRGEAALADVITPVATRHELIGDDRVPVYVAILTFNASSCDREWRTRVDWATLGVCS
jgi:hypothetical protein